MQACTGPDQEILDCGTYGLCATGGGWCGDQTCTEGEAQYGSWCVADCGPQPPYTCGQMFILYGRNAECGTG